MPEIVQKMEFDYPINTLWRLTNSIDQIATIVPGYVNHEIKSEQNFNLSFRVKYGMLKKVVKLHINIHNKAEPHLLTFSFNSDSNHLLGNGKYIARPIDGQSTKVTIHLDVKAQGAMGPMINSVLKNYQPQDEFANNLSKALNKKIREVV